MSAVGVDTSPVYRILSPPQVRQVLQTSSFCGQISHTILPYVTVLFASTREYGMNVMVLVPFGMRVLTPLAN
eukprot:11493654-Ditylum_brightwellii.AAC.1